MKTEYKWTDGRNEDFRKFYLKTEEYYSSIVGGLKAYSASDVEIKRVWVDPEFRGNHISDEMMDALEKKALVLGFRRAILQTRPQMEAAVH